MEVSPWPYLHVITRHRATYLFHRQTGEKLNILTHSFPLQPLVRCDTGACSLIAADGVNIVDSLQGTLALGPPPDEQLFIRRNGQSKWLKDLLSVVSVKAIEEDSHISPKLTLQVYLFEAMAGPTSIWWSLEHILHCVLKGTPYQWFENNRHRVMACLERCGFHDGHIRLSLRSIAWLKRKYGERIGVGKVKTPTVHCRCRMMNLSR